jgi:hypothetical protein
MVVGPGRSVGEHMINDPRLALVSFTGSSEVCQGVHAMHRRILLIASYLVHLPGPPFGFVLFVICCIFALLLRPSLAVVTILSRVGLNADRSAR